MFNNLYNKNTKNRSLQVRLKRTREHVMRIGLMIDPIDSMLSYEKNLELAVDLGFRLLQLWYKDVIANYPGEPEAFRQKLEGMGIELSSLAAYTDIVDPERSREQSTGLFREVIDYAERAGIGYVITESGGKPGELEVWDEMISRFQEITDYAASRKVTVLVENGPGVLVGTTDLMLKMMRELGSDHIGINFDPANLVLIPEDVLDAVERLGDYIMNTHAKDGILLERGSQREIPVEHIFHIPEGEGFIHIPEGVQWVLPPVGEGDVPFEEYINALRGIDFKGDLIIEFQGGGSRRDAITKSKAFLEKLL
jgi:L-ribulose-5-phosphate 3-epimerase